MTLTCRELIEFLMNYLDGELTPEQRAEFDSHLSVCPNCCAYLDSYRKTIELGRAAFANEADEVPSEVPEELVRAVLAARK